MMYEMRALITFFAAFCRVSLSEDFGGSAFDRYDERLLFKPLPDGQVYAHFEFSTVFDEHINDVFWVDHFNLFPLAIGKFLANAKVQEMHFSLAKGFWKNSAWGYNARDAPNGAELTVYFQSFQDNPQKAWRDVTSVLSGHFCASLNFIDKAATVQPVYSFKPEGVLQNGSMRNDLLFYAALPHEALCTENLTPWKKLLPCFDKAGLASLLNARHIFNSHFVSLALDLKPICVNSDCYRTSISITQTISLIFNPPVVFDGKKSWSFIKFFGTPIKEVCQLASESTVLIDITQNDTSNPLTFTTPPSGLVVKKFGEKERKFATFDLKSIISEYKQQNMSKFNIVSLYKKNHVYASTTNPPPVFASRYITGYGVSQGGITCDIYNKLDKSVQIVYFDIIPWYLRIYVHTLKITVANKEIKPDTFYYKPAKDRSQPHHIEMLLTLLPNSVTTIHFDFDRQYLKWTEYPPDANHGVYVNSAVISLKLPTAQNMTVFSETSSSDFFLRIHTQSLLVSLATPDFSMPYNVICLVSTVVSLAFGPIHNLTTRKPQIPKSDEESKKQSLLNRIKNFFQNKKSHEKSD
ncbi:GPI transamidase component PIG-T-like protein [Dinothrombium tinctorium]|uniref:GPI transamidase component PIG-T-like protein n=1 Tax=Dinothrombium tinctorium TaxID=1965070 RepID=A0A443QYA8_9ACAR|nr:GPI transamidase component PIG-T-like protein [Dinothrombium tinctorium]